MNQKTIVGYEALSRATNVPASELLILAANSRLNLSWERVGNTVSFHVDEVARWVAGGYLGREWIGKPMGMDMLDIIPPVENAKAALWQLLNVGNGIQRLIEHGRNHESQYLSEQLRHLLQMVTLLYAASSVGGYKTVSGKANSVKGKQLGSLPWIEDVAPAWLEGMESAQGVVGLSDIDFDELQKSLSDIGWELRRQNELKH
jgi:hypothetical protein